MCAFVVKTERAITQFKLQTLDIETEQLDWRLKSMGIPQSQNLPVLQFFPLNWKVRLLLSERVGMAYRMQFSLAERRELSEWQLGDFSRPVRISDLVFRFPVSWTKEPRQFLSIFYQLFFLAPTLMSPFHQRQGYEIGMQRKATPDGATNPYFLSEKSGRSTSYC